MKIDFDTYIKNRDANEEPAFLKQKAPENEQNEEKNTSKKRDLSSSNRVPGQKKEFEAKEIDDKSASSMTENAKNAQNVQASLVPESIEAKSAESQPTRILRNADTTPFWATEKALSDIQETSKVQNVSKDGLETQALQGFGREIPTDKLPEIGMFTKVKLALDRVLTFWKNKEARRTLGSVPDQKAEKSKQTRNLLLGGAVGLGLVVAFVLLGDVTQKPKVPEVKIYQSDFRVAPETIDKQSFQFQYEEKLDLVNAKLKNLDATMESLNARLKALDKEKAKREGRESGRQTAVSIDSMPDFNPEATGVKPESFLPKAGGTTTESARKLHVLKVYDADRNAAAKFGQAVSSGTGIYGNGNTDVTLLGSRNYRHFRAESPIAPNRARLEAENTYLPAGSFAQAVVLSGVTAATGGNAANNPVPLLLKISDMARLPNQFRANVKSCFVTGSATGDLSSERVWIRLDRLSCMSKSGKAVDVKVQGYATGEDGKTGVRARLVTRSGQAIASAITTGLLSGMGKAVSMSASSTVTYSSGASGTTVNDSLKAGIGQGMEDAMDRIVDYYIRLADKIFPVLELDSGRKVDIVLSQGLTIDLNENTSTKAMGRDAKTQSQTNSQWVTDLGLNPKNSPSK